MAGDNEGVYRFPSQLCKTGRFGLVYTRGNWQTHQVPLLHKLTKLPVQSNDVGTPLLEPSSLEFPIQMRTLIPSPNQLVGYELQLQLNVTTGRRSCRSRRTSFGSLIEKIETSFSMPAQTSSHNARQNHIRRKKITYQPRKAPLPSTVKILTHPSTSEFPAYPSIPKFPAAPKSSEIQLQNKRKAEQASSTASCKKVREMQTLEQQAAQRSIDTARRRAARAHLTPEERAHQWEIDNTRRKLARERKRARQREIQYTCRQLEHERKRVLDTARHKKSREMQTFEQQAAARAVNTARRRASRARQTPEERARQREIDATRRRLARAKKRDEAKIAQQRKDQHLHACLL